MASGHVSMKYGFQVCYVPAFLITCEFYGAHSHMVAHKGYYVSGIHVSFLLHSMIESFNIVFKELALLQENP